MAVKLTEKQFVDGEVKAAGSIVESDATTEASLIAFGKAEPVSVDQPNLIENKTKGGKP